MLVEADETKKQWKLNSPDKIKGYRQKFIEEKKAETKESSNTGKTKKARQRIIQPNHVSLRAVRL